MPNVNLPADTQSSKLPCTAKTHGLSCNGYFHPLVPKWHNMMGRCYKETHQHYQQYGERGITVCQDWHDITTFFNWAIENGWQDKLEIDRIDNDGNYEPSNCRFVTHKENMRNTRRCKRYEFDGKSLTLVEWSEILGIGYDTLRGRLRSGWSVERTLSTPKASEACRQSTIQGVSV
jgi:hypothetical protein